MTMEELRAFLAKRGYMISDDRPFPCFIWVMPIPPQDIIWPDDVWLISRFADESELPTLTIEEADKRLDEILAYREYVRRSKDFF